MRIATQIQWPCLALCLITIPAQAQSIDTVANLPSVPNSLIQGADGNFYGLDNLGGTAVCQYSFGGSGNCGELFKITPDGTFSTLYSFQPGPKNLFPQLASLIQGTDGNFYGTTEEGGSSCNCGTIFKVTPAGVATVLYEFDNTHGNSPAHLIQGSDGNFYGTTTQGGAGTNCFAATTGCGTVFQITPEGVLTTLYSFNLTDGASPGSLIQGADGNFYGAAAVGGPGGFCPSIAPTVILKGCGLVFRITPAGKLTTLYAFQDSTDGMGPSTLIQGKDGNFYGLTSYTDVAHAGSVFQLTPAGVLSTLVVFDSSNGAAPNSLVQAGDGNFYGTSEGASGVLENGVVTQPSVGGTLFELSPAGTLRTIYNFCATGCKEPSVNSAYSLLQASDGNLYGVAYGGPHGAYLFRYDLVPPNVPAISSSGGILNGASFQPGIGSDGWMTINGTHLSTKTDTWTIVKGMLPTMLDGVSVMIAGQPAYIEYVSPTQLNAIAPNVPAGNVAVTVTNANGTSQAATVQLSAEAPAFFQWGNYAVATRQDFSLAVKNGTFAGTTTTPAKPGDVIILWGTGFGPTSPTAPAGMQTPSTTTFNTANAVSVTVGGKSATVYGAALAPGYAGLYQIAIQIPAGLANGDYPVVATIAGVQSPANTLITVQQ